MRSEVYWFANLMEEQLTQNDDKGDWHQCDREYLVARLVEELGELLMCLRKRDVTDSTVISKEAADVANFAMMIADNEQ